jgi:3'-phosphoadenosine 5'-phosphosulfate sulfotransferase (PAPS reductase)/FAD synthetase
MCLKRKLRKPAIKVMAFVGIRGDESHSRSFYEDATDGAKNASQLNLMPILDWGAHELWLYIFANDLLINCAYKKGISRVGCILCPESALRYMWFARKNYPQIVKTYGDIIITTSVKNFKSQDEKDKFIGCIDWGARKSGVVLRKTINYPLEENNEFTTMFKSPHFQENMFYEWIKTLGTIVKERETERQRLKLPNTLDDGIPFIYHTPYTGGGTVAFEFRSKDEQTLLLPLMRAFLRKVSACVACRSCEAECPVGAIIIENGNMNIDGAKCIKCRKCYDIDFSCWRFKSMYKSENEQNKMSGINRYNHFGLREDWIVTLIDLWDKFFPWDENHPLGNKMVQSASAWFQQAMLIESKSRKPTSLAELFRVKGSACLLGWEIIWIALANNTVLVRWFINKTEIDRTYTIERLTTNLRENYPSLGQSAIKDGLTSLKETIARSPLGNDNGVARCEFKGKTLQSITRRAKNVHPLTILYSLYLIAARSRRESFTVRELLTADTESVFVSPLVAFGIMPDTFKKQCEGLRAKYPDYISTTFTHGNDGFDVFPKKYTLEDIINLVLEDIEK